MKKGKKSKLALGIILILVLMFVGSTVVAASEDPSKFTWSPDPIIAGGDTTRSVVFQPPETIKFFTDEDVPIYSNGEIVDWEDGLARRTFDVKLSDLREMYATDPGMEPSFVWEYPNPTYPGNTLTFKNDNKDQDDPFAGKAYFLVPQPTFEMQLKVRYYLPVPSAWNTKRLGENTPARGNFAAFNYGGPFSDTGTVGEVFVDKGRPILSGTWPQTYGKTLVENREMNNLAMPVGATDITDPNSPYECLNNGKVDVTWNRHGFYVYAAKSVAGEGSGAAHELPVDVTVYVEDGGNRIDLGTETLEPAAINGIDGDGSSRPRPVYKV